MSRQLVGGLDPVSLAQGLLQTLRTQLPYERGAVFVRAEGGRLLPLALEGASFVDWDTSLADDTPLGKAWLAPGPTLASEPLGDSPTASSPTRFGHTVLPLRMGSRTFGLVALETHQRPPTYRTGPANSEMRLVEPAMRLVDETALRLETALLFGEVRSIATSEERRRLAREIHDGIAQELASRMRVFKLILLDPAGGLDRGKRLQRQRSELTERSMAHMYETGGMRRVHLKGRDNILKRLLVNAGGFNLALAMRKLLGIGKPRRLQGAFASAFASIGRQSVYIWSVARNQFERAADSFLRNRSLAVTCGQAVTPFIQLPLCALSQRLRCRKTAFTTGC